MCDVEVIVFDQSGPWQSEVASMCWRAVQRLGSICAQTGPGEAMNSQDIEGALRAYDADERVYETFAADTEALIRQIMRSSSVKYHSITSRAKKRDSLAKKLANPEKEYLQLSDVTDLAAVRVTTYFAVDVDVVADMITEEFVIDMANSVDKRSNQDPERFGYRSLHFIASLKPERLALPEYRTYTGKKLEIQVRSILQHAWAEIEHDLGYKSAISVPRDLRRRFSRVASLLELADDEFEAIRSELKDYAASIAQDIAENPGSVPIDNLSLFEIVTSQKSQLHQLTTAVAVAIGGTIAEHEGISDMWRGVAILDFLAIENIRQLEDTCKKYHDLVVAFANKWVPKSDQGNLRLHVTAGILYLGYVLLGERNDTDLSMQFASVAQISEDGLMARRVQSVYAQALAAMSK